MITRTEILCLVGIALVVVFAEQIAEIIIRFIP